MQFTVQLLLGAMALLWASGATLARDAHSYSDPTAFRTTHLSLDLRTDFERRELIGYVDLSLEQVDAAARELVLDTRDLSIEKVELRTASPQVLAFRIGERDPVLGAPLRIQLPAALERNFVVRVTYRTSPSASGLQWLEPEKTAGKQHPFLYSQSQTVHARSWIPLQDTPQIRMTYTARIRTPRALLAVMSAANDPHTARDGDYEFHMPQPIPSYLLALGVGDFTFGAIGPRTGVYAEPALLAAARHEFADVERMLESCEKMFGPYQWGRYDLLMLPPSYMWGGMENPRLTFLTPTVLAGDRSLVSLIAHELAHSWSGNLVTNATWESAWLNEGFTTYLERRIVEQLYGVERRAMEDVLGLQSLQRDMEALIEAGDAGLTQLNMNLHGRNPDDAFTDVAYEKGRLFVGFLEARLGRTRLDAFLRDYFGHFAFQSITSDEFVEFLKARVLSQPDAGVTLQEVRAWLDEPGLPPTAVLPQSDAFVRVDQQRAAWLRGELAATRLPTATWTTHEWLHFLDNLPAQVDAAKLRELDAAWQLTRATNNEIAHSWLKVAIRADYAPAYARLEQFLTSIGRRKFVKDLYEELLKTPAGRQRAERIYTQARALYQVPLVEQLDPLLGR